MTAHLVVPYATVTSLIAVPSGETTGYVRVITAILHRYESCWLAILDEKDYPGVKKCGQQQVHPQKFHTKAVSLLYALWKVVHSLQTCPRCRLLRLGNDAIEPVIVFYSVTHWATIWESTFPGQIQVHCLRRLKWQSNLAPLNLICWRPCEQL